MNNEEKIQACFNLGPIASVYVIEALRVGCEYYIKEFTDDQISQGWGFLDTPEGVRSKMNTILGTINAKD